MRPALGRTRALRAALDPFAHPTFRRNNDFKVRWVRNGWHDRACDNGAGGGYETYCWDTGGWNEWEIANWVFRGCRDVP